MKGKSFFDMADELAERVGPLRWHGEHKSQRPAPINIRPVRLSPKLWPASTFEGDD